LEKPVCALARDAFGLPGSFHSCGLRPFLSMLPGVGEQPEQPGWQGHGHASPRPQYSRVERQVLLIIRAGLPTCQWRLTGSRRASTLRAADLLDGSARRAQGSTETAFPCGPPPAVAGPVQRT